MTAFRLTWPAGAAVAALSAWQGWAPEAPRALSAALRIDAPAHPAQSPSVTLVVAAIDGDLDLDAALTAYVDRVERSPAAVEVATGSPHEVKRWLAGLDEGDGGVLDERERSACFDRDLSAATLVQLVRHLGADRVAGQGRRLDLLPLGGAYADLPPHATAYPHRRARFLVEHTVAVPATKSARMRAAADRWLTTSAALLRPTSTGGVYANWPDPDLPDPDRASYGANLDRLRRVKRAYDPDGLLTPARHS
jgi:FAD/FMN-containing dehydrogenase